MCLGVPGKIMETLKNDMARVDVNGNEVEISMVLTPDVKIGQYVLIHAGFAMQIIDEGDAAESMALLLELQKLRESV